MPKDLSGSQGEEVHLNEYEDILSRIAQVYNRNDLTRQDMSRVNLTNNTCLNCMMINEILFEPLDFGRFVPYQFETGRTLFICSQPIACKVTRYPNRHLIK